VRAPILALLLLMAAPAAAGAATASVVPAPENEACAKYMTCPEDMVVFTAAAGEVNDVIVTEDSVGPERFRFVVRDTGAPVDAGAGCERIDERTAACTAEIFGPVQLGDGDDRIYSAGGSASGGGGDDVLSVRFGSSVGGGGDDVLIGASGRGGVGDDVLIVNTGFGDAGDDTLRCSPRDSMCYLKGGPGNDALRGGPSMDQLFGGSGRDVLRGGTGADRIDCGAGRRDRAVPDRRDRIIRCEQVTRRR
jgi:hypothetical protein